MKLVSQKKKNYTNDLALLAERPAQAEFLLQWLEQAAGNISLNVNPNEF